MQLNTFVTCYCIHWSESKVSCRNVALLSLYETGSCLEFDRDDAGCWQTGSCLEFESSMLTRCHSWILTNGPLHSFWCTCHSIDDLSLLKVQQGNPDYCNSCARLICRRHPRIQSTSCFDAFWQSWITARRVFVQWFMVLNKAMWWSRTCWHVSS